MVTTNVIQRTFKIRFRDSTGTAFTVDHAGRQYLITARHVLPDIRHRDTIDIWHEERWTPLDVAVVGVGQGEIDVTVLAAGLQLSPEHPLQLGAGGLYYSQPVYLLGFPFGRDSGGGEINRGLPIPFVKSGIVSALGFGEVNHVYIDTHANEGFSGGPVVFHPSKGAHELRLAAVVTGYLEWNRPVHDADGRRLADVGENTGIVVAVGTKHVIDLIDANPIGFELPTET